MTNKRNYFLSLSTGMISNIISQIIGLLSVPILLDYFGNQEYGALVVLNSFMSFLILSNFGISEAATILLSKDSDFRNKLTIIKKSIKILLPFIVILYIIFIFVDRNNIVNFLMGDVKNSLLYTSVTSLEILVTFFLVSSMFSLVDSYIISIQRIFIIKIFDTISSILIFLSILFIVYYLHGELWHYFLAIGIIKLFIQILKLIYSLYTFKSHPIENNERLVYQYKDILIVSFRTFLLSIITIIVWSTDNIVIANFLGIEYVIEYSIMFKVFQILNMFNVLFVVSIIPIFSKYFGSNDWIWINNNYSFLIPILSTIGGFAWISGVFFTPFIIDLWLGNKFQISYETIFFLGGYVYLLSIINLNAGLATAFNYLRFTIWIGVAEAIFNLLISIILIKIMNSYVGVAIGTFISALLFPFFMLMFFLPKLTNNMISSKIKYIIYFFSLYILPFITLYLLIVYMFNFSNLVIFLIGTAFLPIYGYITLNQIFNINDINVNQSYSSKIIELKRKYSEKIK